MAKGHPAVPYWRGGVLGWIEELPQKLTVSCFDTVKGCDGRIVFDGFAASGVEALVIKGPVLSVRCYGDPGLRQYGDLDLIVRDEDILRSTELMISLGYEPVVPLKAIHAGRIPGEYVFRQSKTKLLVEFHTERTFRYHPRPLPLIGGLVACYRF